MDLREFARSLRRSWLVVIAIVALALTAGAGYTVLQRPSYEATAQSFFTSNSGSTASDVALGNDFVQQAVTSFAQVATSAIVLSNVSDDLSLNETPAQLREQVSVEVPVDTVLLNVTVTDRSPARAAKIANAVTSNLAVAVRGLTPEQRNATSVIRLTQIEPATAPTTPTSPNLPLNLGIAALLGVLLGVGLAVLRQRLDTRTRDASDAREVTGAPVLGEIVFDPGARRHPLVNTGGDDSRRAEGFRALRTNLQFLEYDNRSGSMVVTSSLASEGKSVSAANLAVVMAEAGRRVVVVDADLRRPQLAAYFGLEGHVGLTDVLIGAVTLQDALQTWGDRGPVVLPSGRIPPNPSELLQSDAMRDLISALEEQFDTVLIDAPPIVPVTDAAILARVTGGALLLAAVGKTRKADLRRAAANLEQIDARLLGLVLTMVPAKRSASYSYNAYGISPSAKRQAKPRRDERNFGTDPHPSQ